MGGAIFLMTQNGFTRWARALPVAIFTTIQLGIDNWENKILIWWPQLPKEPTGGDGYKYRFKSNAVPWIFFPPQGV